MEVGAINSATSTVGVVRNARRNDASSTGCTHTGTGGKQGGERREIERGAEGDSGGVIVLVTGSVWK